MTSIIKVDDVQNQPGTNIINKCSTTITVGAASDNIRSAGNNLQASDGGNLISQSGTDITLGASGDTINLASGASQSGFGRTGTVDWVTTPKVTGDSPITGVTGKGYFLNTTAGTITFNLPAGAAGSIVSMADYAATWQTNNVTVSPNGSEKIGGVNADVTLDTEGQSITLVYIDSTQGWINTMDSTSNVRGETFVAATVSGACNTLATSPDCADVKIATFVGPGTFCVSTINPCAANNAVSYMVVAGGGSGGQGGSGAGGFREFKSPVTPYTASPLEGSTPITVAVQCYPITVGAGGASCSGSASNFSTVPSAGGGGSTTAGGSGGGNRRDGGGSAGAGNTPPVSPPQGNNGGTSTVASWMEAAGGGGATAAGTGGSPSGAGNGGAGATTNISASPTIYAGGGGGSAASTQPPSTGVGGPGGGGAGNIKYEPPLSCARAPGAGGVNTGGGGGGNYTWPTTGGGGSGIVIIRYKFQ